MAALNELLGNILAEINLARSEADKKSASLALQYAKDNVLKYFDVPRIDIAELTIELRVAFEKGKNEKSTQVIFETEQLAKIPDSKISTIRLTTKLRNYEWSQGDSEQHRSLTEKS